MYSYAKDYYFTLLAYLIIPFYVQLDQKGQGLKNHEQTSFQAQSQEEIDRLCKEEIDNLFTGDDEDCILDSPLFSRLREKEQTELHAYRSDSYQPIADWNKPEMKEEVVSVFSVDEWTDDEVGMWKDGYGSVKPTEIRDMTSMEFMYCNHALFGFDIKHDTCTHFGGRDINLNFGDNPNGEGPPPYFNELFNFLDDDEGISM